MGGVFLQCGKERHGGKGAFQESALLRFQFVLSMRVHFYLFVIGAASFHTRSTAARLRCFFLACLRVTFCLFTCCREFACLLCVDVSVFCSNPERVRSIGGVFAEMCPNCWHLHIVMVFVYETIFKYVLTSRSLKSKQRN